MSKRYKVFMFVLLGVGALMVIGGIGSFSESVGQGIFGIILGLIVGLPLLLLYKPLSDKKAAEAKAAKRAEQRRKEAAEQEEERERQEWMRTHDAEQVWLDTVSQTKAAAAMKKADAGKIEYVTMKRYYKDDKLRLALIVDDEKIGDVVDDAETVSDKWRKAQKAEFDPSFIKMFNDKTGEMEIAVCVDITFTLPA